MNWLVCHCQCIVQGCPQVGAGGRNPLILLSMAPPTFSQFNTFCAIFLLLPMRPTSKVADNPVYTSSNIQGLFFYITFHFDSCKKD